MPEAKHEYDVAISFLATDEPLAVQIREALAPLNVFVYSKEQEEIAGNEGVEVFREVFHRKTSASLVLYREGWGKTPWTRVEEAAIRDHCLAEGWDRLMFVRLDHIGDAPKWVPDSYIYLDFTAIGISDLVGAVKAKLAKLGVDLRPLSPVERAQQIAAREKFDAETHDLLRRGSQPFLDASTALFSKAEEILSDARGKTGWKIESGHNQQGEFVASVEDSSIVLVARNIYSNTAVDAYLMFRAFRGIVLTPQQRGKFWIFEKPQLVWEGKIELERLPEIGWCWNFDGKTISSTAMAAVIVDKIISNRENAKGQVRS